MDSATRRAAIVAELATLGPVVPARSRSAGRVVRVQAVAAGPTPVLHGPYPTWTRRDGRQVTTTLSAEEAAHLEPAIAANRRLRVGQRIRSALVGRTSNSTGEMGRRSWAQHAQGRDTALPKDQPMCWSTTFVADRFAFGQ